VNNLPKVITQRCLEQNLNLRPIGRKSNALSDAPPCHVSRRKSHHRALRDAGMSFSNFGELWLAWSHGGGITSGMSYKSEASEERTGPPPHCFRDELYRNRMAVGIGGGSVILVA